MPKGAARCRTVPHGTGPRVALIELRPNCAHTQCWHAPTSTLVGAEGTTRFYFAPWRLCARSLALLRTRTRQEENQAGLRAALSEGTLILPGSCVDLSSTSCRRASSRFAITRENACTSRDLAGKVHPRKTACHRNPIERGPRFSPTGIYPACPAPTRSTQA